MTKQVKTAARKKKMPVEINGKELKRRRERLGMTLKDLGAALGSNGKPIPITTIWRWEDGFKIAHPRMLSRAMDSIEREAAADPSTFYARLLAHEADPENVPSPLDRFASDSGVASGRTAVKHIVRRSSSAPKSRRAAAG